MTRETKIGLLVGLAFIIVIGILLSEHVSSTNEPQQAAIVGAGSNVRESVTTPGGSDGEIPPVTLSRNPAEPTRPVPTRADLRAASPPISFVPGNTAPPTGPDRGPDATSGHSSGTPANDSRTTEARRGPESDGQPLPHGLRELVLQHPGDLVPVDPAGRRSDGPAVAHAPPIQYTAVAGDNLSKMAAHLLGSNTKANRDLLLRANPTLQSDGNLVIAGKTYIVPRTASGVASTGGADENGATNQGPPRSPAPRSDAGNVDPEHAPRPESAQWYTVRGNDNLWKIAEAQLGNGNAWTMIRDMNKDLLKGGETVHPNMRLRIPIRSASAD